MREDGTVAILHKARYIMRIIRIYNWTAILPAMPRSAMSPALLEALAIHYESLVDYVRRRFDGPGPSIAREAVHDMCVKLMERPPAYEVHTPLAFFRRASTRCAIDRRRGDITLGKCIELTGAVPDIHSHVEDGSNLLDFEQQVAALAALVEAMPPRARQCFLLHRIHGMTHESIAHEIGITRSMVTHHFNHAMRRLASAWSPARGFVHG